MNTVKSFFKGEDSDLIKTKLNTICQWEGIREKREWGKEGKEGGGERVWRERERGREGKREGGEEGGRRRRERRWSGSELIILNITKLFKMYITMPSAEPMLTSFWKGWKVRERNG